MPWNFFFIGLTRSLERGLHGICEIKRQSSRVRDVRTRHRCDASRFECGKTSQTFLSFAFFRSFFLFGHFFFFFWGITFTLVRKFQVEFMAALYLASNMHEPPFKPVPVPPPTPAPSRAPFACFHFQFSLLRVGNKFVHFRFFDVASSGCPCHVLNLKIVSIGVRRVCSRVGAGLLWQLLHSH